MGRIAVFLIFLVCLYGAYNDYNKPKGESDGTLKKLSSVFKSEPSIPKVRRVNGAILVTEHEMKFISEQVSDKYYRKDYSPIKLSDGTKIPLIFKPNGKICPRTGLPEGTISLGANIGIVQN